MKNNLKKRLNVKIDKKVFSLFLLKTRIFIKGDDYIKNIFDEVKTFFEKNLKSARFSEKYKGKKWFLVSSEKIIAIAQGRSFFIWEIETGFWANFLSKMVTKTPYGIGLGSKWTMQLAINEVGLWRILLGTIIAGITKPFGVRGLFYNIVGSRARAIDGPTEYSLFPSNLSAKLSPKNPDKVVKKIDEKVINKKLNQKNYLGSVIIDANDLGRNILANSTDLPNSQIEKIFSKNPMGQADEQTPLTVVFF